MHGAEALTHRMSVMEDIRYGSNVSPEVVDPVRPLGAFSDFICEGLGSLNDLVREGLLLPGELWSIVNTAFGAVDDTVFEHLLGSTAPVKERRVALLDLLFASRSLDIAVLDPEERRQRRWTSRIGHRMIALATVENRHPVLSWSEIAIYHPADDPRSFLVPGEARDQEVFMYRVQRAMEEIFADAVCTPTEKMDDDFFIALVRDLSVVVKAMSYLNRVRRIGQFYKLDPFLGENGEFRGHGTGAFSVWSFLIGVFLTGNNHYRARLLDPDNFLAFDRDADSLIDDVREGRFRTAAEVIDDSPLGCATKQEMRKMHAQASDKFAVFLQAHRGAMKRHSPNSFDVPAPSVPEMTNIEAITVAIHDARPEDSPGWQAGDLADRLAGELERDQRFGIDPLGDFPDSERGDAA